MRAAAISVLLVFGYSLRCNSGIHYFVEASRRGECRTYFNMKAYTSYIDYAHTPDALEVVLRALS